MCASLVKEGCNTEQTPWWVKTWRQKRCLSHFLSSLGGEEIRGAAMAYVPDLLAKVFELLDANEE